MFYSVTWEIRVDADSAEEAARFARDVQLDPDSEATYFSVQSDENASAAVMIQVRR